MNIYVWKYTKAQGFQTVTLIDYAISVIWIRRFQECGEFELYLPATAELFSLFWDGLTFLTKEDEIETAMKVESVQLTTDPEEGDRLIVSGRSAECILSQRIVTNRNIYDEIRADSVIFRLIYNNAIPHAQLIESRGIPEMANGTIIDGFEETVSGSFYMENLLDSVWSICKTGHIGFRTIFTGSGFINQPYAGADRTQKVIFSSEFENLGNTEYLYDMTNYFNSVTETAKKEDWICEATVTDNSEGMLLIEHHVESENLDTSEMTADDLRTELNRRAKNNLYQSKVKQEFSGEIVNTEMYRYGIDYNLGDKVSIVNGYGIEGTATITEITEIEDASGYRLIPTFSDWKVIT